MNETELALKRYDTIMGHLRFDQTLFWTRFGFLLASEIGIFGIFFKYAFAFESTPTKSHNIFLMALPLIGILLVMLFSFISNISSKWISH